MPRLNLLQKTYFIFLIGLAITMPIGFKVNNYFLIGVLLTWLLNIKPKCFIASLKQNREFWWAVSLFGIFLFSLTYTQNLKQGWKDLEYKLSLLLLPLALLTTIEIPKKRIKQIVLSFAYSCLGVSVFLLAKALLVYLQTNDASVIFYHKLAGYVDMHAVYLSAYFLFGIFIFVHSLLESPNLPKRWKVLHGLSALVLLLLLVLLSSKLMLGVFITVVLFSSIYLLYKRKRRILGLSFAVGLVLVTYLTVQFVPFIKNRALEVYNSKFSVLSQDRFEYNTEFSGLTLRLLFWKYAFEILEEENAWILGVGTGDSQDALNQKYINHNLYTGYGLGSEDIGYLNYDTHNQYIETFLKTGALGLSVLILYLLRNIRLASSKGDALYLVFLFIFVCFCLTDTTLQGNKGIVFFAFFNSLFLSGLRPKDLKKSLSE